MGRRQRRRRDLVEQRLEQVMVVAVDQDHLRAGVRGNALAAASPPTTTITGRDWFTTIESLAGLSLVGITVRG